MTQLQTLVEQETVPSCPSVCHTLCHVVPADAMAWNMTGGRTTPRNCAREHDDGQVYVSPGWSASSRAWLPSGVIATIRTFEALRNMENSCFHCAETGAMPVAMRRQELVSDCRPNSTHHAFGGRQEQVGWQRGAQTVRWHEVPRTTVS